MTKINAGLLLLHLNECVCLIICWRYVAVINKKHHSQSALALAHSLRFPLKAGLLGKKVAEIIGRLKIQ